MEENYGKLADAVVRQAVEDYRDAYLGYEVDGVSPEESMKDLEYFFHGEFFEKWCDSQDNANGNPDAFVREIKKRTLEELIGNIKELRNNDGDILVFNNRKACKIPPIVRGMFEVSLGMVLTKLNEMMEEI